MWFRWIVFNVVLPLLPFGLSIFFRVFADDGSPPSGPPLWNSELPFFTLVIGLANSKIFFDLQRLKVTDRLVYERMEKAIFATAALLFFSLLLLALYYWDQHVVKIGVRRQYWIGRAQLLFAVVQAGLGAGMRYAEDKFGDRKGP